MSMDRRALLTALAGACVAAGAIGAMATSAAAVPRIAGPKPDREPEVGQAAPEAEGEATLHNAQYVVIRRRPRRRWYMWRRPRRRRVYFY